jgi:hypothetical protein
MVKLQEVQDFFFKAMLQGWASNAAKTLDPQNPGHKHIRIVENGWMLIDQYYVDHRSLKSAGSTKIWYDDKLLWIMAYGGYYEKEASAFVKKVLLHTYGLNMFCGGRGMPNCRIENLYYLNQADENGFNHFRGWEQVKAAILGGSAFKSLGFHDYWGMSLL